MRSLAAVGRCWPVFVGSLLVAASALAGAATSLSFLEQEPGIEPYRTRVVVTDGFLRQDYGPQDPDFLLFDRAARVVYSVDSADRTILVVSLRSEGSEQPPPIALDLQQRRSTDADAPSIAGRAAVLTRYEVNGEHCYDTVSIPGWLTVSRAALGELRTVLAAQHLSTLYSTPREYWDPCVLALDIFYPAAQLQAGFPMLEWGRRGFRRELVGFDEEYVADPALFALPPGYTHITSPSAALTDSAEPAVPY